MEFPYLGLVDLATPERARIAHWSFSRDKRINMQLKKYKSSSRLRSRVQRINLSCEKCCYIFLVCSETLMQ